MHAHTDVLQDDLFGAPPVCIGVEPRKLARREDPVTSHKAAARVSEFARGHKAVILDALLKYGPMTVDEIATRTRLQSQQINKRTSDLEDACVIELTGQTRMSASGREERVWRLV